MKNSLCSILKLVLRGIQILKSYGISHFTSRLWKYVKRQGWRHSLTTDDLNSQYRKWLAKKSSKEQPPTIVTTGNIPDITILMFVSNPLLYILQEAVKSILNQDSANWQLLCITNDALSENSQVLEYLNKLAEQDERICFMAHNTCQGVSEAANSALHIVKSDYIFFIEQHNILRPDAISAFQLILSSGEALDLVYADEDELDGYSQRVNPHFKPGWSPHLLHSYNYIGHSLVVRKDIVEKAGGFRKDFDGRQDFDLLLRLSDLTLKVKRIPDVLCSRRISGLSYEELDTVTKKECLAIAQSFERKGYSAKVTYCREIGLYNARIKIKNSPKVSIIIPTKDNAKILKHCVESIRSKSSYYDYEIIIIDNGSKEDLALKYLDSIKEQRNCKVLEYPHQFNYPLINNFGAANADGEHLVFLNDDTEIITSDWIDALLEQSQMPEVGAVGALLIFPNGLIQHAGIVVGMRGSASHAFYKCDSKSASMFNLVQAVRDVSAVTAACLMIKTKTFNEVGGFNPAFRVGLNDVDLCLRLLKKGLINIYTPHAKLIHYESLTRGEYVDEKEIELFKKIYQEFIANGDPYYHPELSLERNDYSLAV